MHPLWAVTAINVFAWCEDLCFVTAYVQLTCTLGMYCLVPRGSGESSAQQSSWNPGAVIPNRVNPREGARLRVTVFQGSNNHDA